MHVESTLGCISTDAQAPAAADSLAECLHTRNGSFEVGIAPCGPAHPWRAALVELDRRSASADLNELPGDPAVRHATLVCAPFAREITKECAVRPAENRAQARNRVTTRIMRGVPPNAYLNAQGNGWKCERGFEQHGATCISQVIPEPMFDHAEWYRDACVSRQLTPPARDHGPVAVREEPVRTSSDISLAETGFKR